MSLKEAYDLDHKSKVLGQGSTANVRRAWDKETGAVRAVKVIRKHCPELMEDPSILTREIDIMRVLDHPNIVKLYETYEDKRMVYLVMELCEGGELFDRVMSEAFTEVQVAILMQQILHAVHYMHTEGICHRDLKPENLLLLTKGPIESNLLKLVDFGAARKFAGNLPMKTVIGSPFYIAPQVLMRCYDNKSDLWSCGVLMYIFLCGKPPFPGRDEAEVFRHIRRGIVKFDHTDWIRVSVGAKDLVRRLLTVSPEQRITSDQALKHPWVRDKAPGSATTLSKSFALQLRDFHSHNRLKQAALQVIARNLDEAEIAAMREAFIAMDNNGDGILSAQELIEGMKNAGISEVPTDLLDIFNSSKNGDTGTINYTEFLAAAIDQRQDLKDDVFWAAFRVFDRNGDGKISPDELQRVLDDDEVQGVLGADELRQAEIRDLLAELDADGDGQIDFEEFTAMMRSAGIAGKGATDPPPEDPQPVSSTAAEVTAE